ncbi:hypothetical protein PR003_g12265 [Phytophthora rubi]|uniref:Uncharacterized protein n=1 Tax=Phytophthora rubi TaxID=129364 RepID=A0A6A4FD39_9STRA|nr:hypothetical protein PR002_g10328 [Phytophthora rubi]KAE9033301.1 hypothetical protein PR001_g10227 [Phytophthora rubi]KAE9336921.1 hypothetical protein PR003_g12265 [Phytophthora rubi]
MASTANTGSQPRLSPSASSSVHAASTNLFVRMPHARGVRRRREESAAVEIEELDSRTMRQNSYNYFQQHGAGSGPPLLRTSTFHSSLGRSPASRKRQRTLAEQLDELCLQGSRGRVVGLDSAKNRSKSRSARRLAREKARQEAAGGARIVELDEFGQEKAASVDGSGSDSDGMMDTTGEQAGMKVYGDVADVGGLRSFFAAGAGGHHRPLDRMYRHYVAVAQAAAASTAPQGNEMVVFRPPAPVATSFAENLPAYLSLTPHEFENLSMTEKRQWYQAHSRYMRELDQAAAEQKNEYENETQLEAKPTDVTGGFEASRRRSSSASSSRSYRVLGVPSTDEDDDRFYDDFEEDVEMMEDIDDDAAPKCPRAAGAVSHSEWFTDDEL